MTDQKWPDSMQPATPLVIKDMSEREREEAEEAAGVAAMTDYELVATLRLHLTRTFIGRDVETREITKDDGTPGSIEVRKPHRYVEFFDELVRKASHYRGES